MVKIVDAEPIRTMCVAEEGEAAQVAGRAFEKLESIVPLQGRKFYGVFDAPTRTYRACTKMKEGDDPSGLGLEEYTIAGGQYATEKLEGAYLDIVKKIGPTFEQLAENYRGDSARPSVEFYRRHTEVHLLYPILQE